MVSLRAFIRRILVQPDNEHDEDVLKSKNSFETCSTTSDQQHDETDKIESEQSSETNLTPSANSFETNSIASDRSSETESIATNPSVKVGLALSDQAVKNEPTMSRLPVEILIEIAAYLDPVSRLLFSLSSRHLRTVLTQNLDLSLERNSKISFLRLLEWDLPDLIICYDCARMFKWKLQANDHYRCPGSFKVPGFVHRHIPAWFCLSHRDEKHSQEAVQLVLRAWARGPEFGLPSTSLNHTCDKNNEIWNPGAQLSQRLEGQLIGDRFVLARYYILNRSVTDEQIASMHDLVYFFCKNHDLWTTYKRIFATRPELAYRGSLTMPTIKCSTCDTDMNVKFTRLPGEKLRIEVNVWQDLGRWNSREIDTAKVIQDHIAKIPRVDPAERDLECDFNTGGHQECGQGKILGEIE